MSGVELTGENELTHDEAKALALCVLYTAKNSDWGRWTWWQEAATGKAKLDAALTQHTSPLQEGEGRDDA